MRDYHTDREARPTFAFFLLLLLALICSAACGSSSPNGANASGPVTSDGRPEITEEKILQNINGQMVAGVAEETSKGEPINWYFDSDEPKEFTLLEKQMNGDKATIVIDMKTRTVEGSRNPRQLSGKIRLRYELQTELVLRKWRIVEVENISMKYRNEPRKEPTKEPTKEPKEEQDQDES
jgi:hypothetical protein